MLVAVATEVETTALGRSMEFAVIGAIGLIALLASVTTFAVGQALRPVERMRDQIDGVAVAGKTGTAQSGFDEGTVRDNPHAWFTSFAPADDPQIAVAVMIVNGADPNSSEYSGGQLAAPVARAVIEAVLG